MPKTPEEYVREFLATGCWEDYPEFFDDYVIPLLRIHGGNFAKQLRYDAEESLRSGLYLRFGTWDPARPLKPWLSQIVRNCLRDCAKKTQWRDCEFDEHHGYCESTPLSSSIKEEEVELKRGAILRALDSLSPRNQLIIKRIFPMIGAEGNVDKEPALAETVAGEFGMTRAAIDQIKCRFRREVEHELGRHGTF